MIITDITKIGDPQIVLYDGKYYCYATNCEHFCEGFDVRVSDDLADWSEPIRCFHATTSWGKSHFWAPEVVYHGGKFIMHYSAMSRELNSLRIGVAVSDSPTGPFRDVFDAPMFDMGYAAIDGSVLISDAGNFLYYSRDCSENVVDGIRVSQLYCVELDESLTKCIGEHTLVSTPTEEFERKSLNRGGTPTLWNEGPTVIFDGNYYIMNYSANCYATNDYAICISYAKSPRGPFIKPKGNPVLSCRDDLFGSGHNAFFKTKSGELMTAFHIQTNPMRPSGDRRVVIGKVDISYKDGVPYQSID